MKQYKELKEVVVSKLLIFNLSNYNPTAKEIYNEIKKDKPKLVIKGFKSFVKVINIFPEVKPISEHRGIAKVYKFSK